MRLHPLAEVARSRQLSNIVVLVSITANLQLTNVSVILKVCVLHDVYDK